MSSAADTPCRNRRANGSGAGLIHHHWVIHFSLIHIGLISFGILSVAWAEEPLAVRVADLVRRLDASSRADRTAAEKGLIDLGPSVLPLLPTEPMTTGHPLNRVRRILDTRRQTELLAPAVFAPPDSPETLGDLLDRFESRFKPEWDHGPLPDSVRNRPWSQSTPRTLWEIVAQLEQGEKTEPGTETGTERLIARLGEEEQDERWRLVPQSTAAPITTLIPAGAYAVRLTKAESQAGLEVLAQPKVRGLLVFWDLRTLRWTDAKGELWVPKNPRAQYELPWTSAGRSPKLTVEFLAAPTPDIPRTVAGLSGEFEVIATAGEDLFRFEEALVDKPARPLVRRIGRTTVTVDRPELKRTEKGTKVRFVVLTTRHAEVAETTASGERIVPAVMLESHQFGLVPHAARLVSMATGKFLEPSATVRAEFFSPGTTRAEYEFQGIAEPGADWSLECTTTAVLGRERVRFHAADFDR